MLPLTGIRILDLSRLLPGPYCTQLLQDQGAEVIKVETPLAGDYARHVPPGLGLDGLFEAVNRGKQSVAINYRNPRGRELALKLAAGVDVVLESFRPGAVRKWKIDYEAVKAVNPRVIYCSLSGYGQAGPYRDRAGHDLNYIAIGGLLDLNGAAGGPPIPPGVQIADLAAGMLAATAILGALVGRGRTGQGAYLDISMLDAVVSWAGPLGHAGARRGQMPLSGGLPCFNVYAAADGQYLSLAALEPTFWSAFCQRVERPDLVDKQYAPETFGELRALFAHKTRPEWLAHFEGADVCLEPVNTFEEMLSHPQVRARGLAGADGRLNSAYVFAQNPVRPPAPALGAHTREVLAGLGLADEEIDDLQASGVVKCASSN